MSIFKGHKISIIQLLDVIPEALLNHLSENTKVDHYSKVLQGKKMFYLLIYGLLENNRLRQCTLEDTFIVSDISGKMSEGLENNGRKSIKYTMAFDGILPCLSEIFTERLIRAKIRHYPKQ